MLTIVDITLKQVLLTVTSHYILSFFFKAQYYFFFSSNIQIAFLGIRMKIPADS